MTYAEEKALEIKGRMEKNNRIDEKISTCDYPNWDVTLHRAFPLIAQKLKDLGFLVTSSVNWGVTDWVIVNPNAEAK